MVAPENVSHVKSCLPPALRDYVDQIIEGWSFVIFFNETETINLANICFL